MLCMGQTSERNMGLYSDNVCQQVKAIFNVKYFQELAAIKNLCYKDSISCGDLPPKHISRKGLLRSVLS